MQLFLKILSGMVNSVDPEQIASEEVIFQRKGEETEEIVEEIKERDWD